MSARASLVRAAREPRSYAAPLVLLALAVLSGASTASGPAPPPAAAPAHRGPGSIKDEPGYIETADPESMSVVLGRRLHAPAVRARFAGGGRSLDDLGRRLCRALDVNRADSVRALCVTDAEFRDILWREFPQSRPATGLAWVDAWRILFARLNGGSIGAVNDYGGHRYDFQRFERESVAVYRNFRLHNRLTMVVKNEAGEVERWNWLRSVAERKGVFKVYSMRD